MQHAHQLPGEAQADTLIFLQQQADLMQLREHALQQGVVAEAAWVEQPVRQRVLLARHLVGSDYGRVLVVEVGLPCGHPIFVAHVHQLVHLDDSRTDGPEFESCFSHFSFSSSFALFSSGLRV